MYHTVGRNEWEQFLSPSSLDLIGAALAEHDATYCAKARSSRKQMKLRANEMIGHTRMWGLCCIQSTWQ
eukprot:CCRYP_017707-RA/>CCRYP_017707-RA protein AED:0.08 eAED:0.08 QI:6/1/1/1/0/0/2/252/68